jgi:hypothetical protein
MFGKCSTLITAIAISVLSASLHPAQASFHEWNINEIYTNADGTVQFVELFTTFNSQQFTDGLTIRASQGANTNDFVFPDNTPAPTGNHHLLIATTGFASLPGAVTPDFTLPDGFLFSPDGTVNFIGADSRTYTSLPTDGVLSIHYPGENTDTNSPTNYAGQSGSVNSPPGASPTPSPTPMEEPTETPTETPEPTNTPIGTPTLTTESTATATETAIAPTETFTPTESATATETMVPTNTSTPDATVSSTATPTETPETEATPTPTFRSADLSGDGEVDSRDLLLFLTQWRNQVNGNR